MRRLTAIASVRRRSGLAGVAGDLGWGAVVAVVSALVVGGCAVAWQWGGYTFGSHPLVWWALGRLGFALVGAAFTARTAAPAALVLAVVVVAAVVVAAQRPAGAGELAQARQRDDAVASAEHLALAFTYVTALAGYDRGSAVQTNTTSGLSRMYVPLDELPLDGQGPDHSVVLNAQQPAPAACGRVELLPFDTVGVDTCEQLGDGSFHRLTDRYHEVVVVRPGVVLSATAAREVPVEVLQRAVADARPASRAQIEPWNRGAAWLPGQDGEGAPAVTTAP